MSVHQLQSHITTHGLCHSGEHSFQAYSPKETKNAKQNRNTKCLLTYCSLCRLCDIDLGMWRESPHNNTTCLQSALLCNAKKRRRIRRHSLRYVTCLAHTTIVRPFVEALSGALASPPLLLQEVRGKPQSSLSETQAPACIQNVEPNMWWTWGRLLWFDKKNEIWFDLNHS